MQSRKVICAQYNEGNLKEANDESKCTVSMKPEETKECELKETCSGQWFAGPWSNCDKECGGGQRTRKVLCLSNGKSVPETQCDEETIEFGSEECNKAPCGDDGILPVDTTSSPITEDDLGEEWCDDEDEDNKETTDSIEVVGTTIDITSTESTITNTSDDTDTTLVSEDDLMFSDSTYSTCKI